MATLSHRDLATDTRTKGGAYPQGIRIPAYRRHPASGRGIIQFAPLWGRHPHYLAGKYDSPESRADYDQCVARVVEFQLRKRALSLPKGKPTKRANRKTITVVRFIARYMAWAIGHHKDNKREIAHLRNMVKPMAKRYAARPLRTIGPLRAKRLREDMIKLGWSRKYVNAQFGRFRRMLAWGAENELLSATQLATIEVIRGLRAGFTNAPERPKVGPVAWREVEAVLPYLAPTVANMVRLHYLCGMRSSEVTAMRAVDIEFREDVWVYTPPRHKTAYLGKAKTVCLGPQAQALLLPYLASCEIDEYFFSPRRAVREHLAARAVASKTKRYGSRKKSRSSVEKKFGARYTTHGYHQAIRHGLAKLLKVRRESDPEAAVTKWHPHQLRHSRATITREAYGLEGVQSQLGNTRQAAEIYAERAEPLAVRIALETG